MPHIVLASTNPVKARATTNAFNRRFPDQDFTLETLSVESGVKDQPDTSDETLQGALNRVAAIYQTKPEADYWVGIEGGIECNSSHETGAFAWAVVKSKTHLGKGKTGEFYLPPKIVELLSQGKTLGEADDIVFSQTNSAKKNGAVGILTNDLIPRSDFNEQAVILALIPHAFPKLYPPSNTH